MKTKLTFLFVLCASLCFAQNDSISSPIDTIKQPTIDERLENITRGLEQINIDLSLKNRYKMYQTENIYNLLKLDTKTGMIWQVQWSLDSDNEGTMIINDEDLTYGTGGYGSNSFELYPTKNMYQFILIEKTTGRTWHVQWGTGGSSSRWIRRIW